MKKFTALLLLLAMALSLAACGPSGSGETNPPSTSSTPPSSSAQTEAPTEGTTAPPATEPEVDNQVVEYYMSKANEVTVTDTQVLFTDDGSGQELAIDKEPKKVAVLYGSLVALWYEAGGTVPLAVGGKSAVTLYKEQIGRDITQDEGVKVVTEKSSGTGWDVEAILAEKPDLIVCSMGMKGYETISGPAAAVGIPVIGIDYDGVQDYLKWFKVFCNLTGNAQLWDEMAEKTANGIIDIVSKVPQVEQAPTAVILTVSSDTLKAYTGESQPGTILHELGGVNLADPDNTAKSSSVEISLEDLYALDPDYLFLSWYDEPGQMYNQLRDMVGDNPVWQELRAVKEDRFYQLDKNLFHNKANHLYDQAYQVLAAYIYPDTEF